MVEWREGGIEKRALSECDVWKERVRSMTQRQTDDKPASLSVLAFNG